jgi:hypothetical protein
VVEEAEQLIKDPDFKGYIHDVGGPTANFRQQACEKQLNTAPALIKVVFIRNPVKT